VASLRAVAKSSQNLGDSPEQACYGPAHKLQAASKLLDVDNVKGGALAAA
jgi:hypothetical protein